ncbi:hypothetical protein JW960_04060 [candidate division KSB1 bacterium]|nr:hypothetical protein [candidate division KSB1 bacterium]
MLVEKYYTRDFDLIEHIPPSSNALREKIGNILKGSQNWTANVSNIDKITGSYQIILQGTLNRGESQP